MLGTWLRGAIGCLLAIGAVAAGARHVRRVMCGCGETSREQVAHAQVRAYVRDPLQLPDDPLTDPTAPDASANAAAACATSTAQPRVIRAADPLQLPDDIVADH